MSGVRAESQPRKSAALRGYGHKWRVAREIYLRSNPLCVMCRADGYVVAATVVDHIIPHRGDMRLFWDMKNNVQSLCVHCHSSVKQKEERLLY